MSSPEAPARIEIERLILRPWREDEIDALQDAIGSSLDHLRRWLSWALHEPESREDKLERIRGSLADFEAGRRHVYGVYERNREELMGCVGLEEVSDGAERLSDPASAREIGYWLREDCTGKGYMTEAVRAVTRMAIDRLGVGRIEIQCDPVNRASAEVPRRVGCRHEMTLHANQRNPRGELRDTMIWVMDR
jgi:RimJ/RimL family protein N-acetyltransferase